MKVSLWDGYWTLGCKQVGKVCTKLEKTLRSNPVVSLVLGQIGILTSYSGLGHVGMCVLVKLKT